MLRDQGVAALRSLINGKFHAAMNIAGLAVWFAAAILLLLYVHDETTYDDVFPADINRMSWSITLPGGNMVVFDGTDYALAQGMRLDIPQIQTIARMMPQDWTVRRDRTEANETVYWADSALLSLLPLQAIAGDLATALDAPGSVVLTRGMARKYFGKDSPVGETLQLGRAHPLRVTAVIRDLPPNTHFAAQILASGTTPFSNLAEMDARPEGFHFDGTTYTYFRLRSGASLAAIRPLLRDVVENRLHIPKENAFGVAIAVSAIPVRDIHFTPAGINPMKTPGDKATVWAAAIIALLILTGACVNFINLTTARVSRRALEVGVRKAAGAGRGTLTTQFITEAILQVGAGMIIALAMVEQLLPAFNSFLQRDIGFAYWQPNVAGLLLLIVLAVSLLAGTYPALVLSSLRPATALRGGPGYLDKGRLRRILVVVQFAILTGLMIASAIIWRQTQFAMASAMRLSAENMILVSAPCSDPIRNGLADLPGVESVTCSQPTMISSEDEVQMMETSPADIYSLRTLSVDTGFLESYGLKPLAGRLIDRAHGDLAVPPKEGEPQTVRMVINETALHNLGLHDPEKAIGLRLEASMERGRKFFTVIGVVPDFPTGSVRIAVPPTAYFADPGSFGMLSARVKPGQVAEVTAGIGEVWAKTEQSGLPKVLPLSLYASGLYRDILREGILFAIATGVALFIACVGLFGMALFMAEQRTKEIGVRKAMGATTGQVAALLLWQFVTPVLWANLIAWPIVWWLVRRWLAGFAYHTPLTIWLFLAGGGITLAVTLITVAGQAILVARRPPVAALRYE